MMDAIYPFLPRRPRGRPSAEAEAGYRQRLEEFCARILKIRSSLDFAIGSRDWCYMLEQHGLRKGDSMSANGLSPPAASSATFRSTSAPRIPIVKPLAWN